MRFGITAKLFLAIFATCMLVLITMHWGVRMSFERGFVDYIKQGNAQYGDWTFLRNNERLVFKLLHTMDQNEDDGNSMRGWQVRLWVLDAQRNRLFGSPAPIAAESTWQAIRHQGMVIGWVVASPVKYSMS